jgi:hypothetical protein
MDSLSLATWSKSSHSTHSNGGCVEVGRGADGTRGLRDSNRPDAGTHTLSSGTFDALTADARRGVFDR